MSAFDQHDLDALLEAAELEEALFSSASTVPSAALGNAAESAAAAAHARSLLESALLLDERSAAKAECIAAYLSAADAHLAAIELSTSAESKAALSAQTAQILDRVAYLKKAAAASSASAAATTTAKPVTALRSASFTGKSPLLQKKIATASFKSVAVPPAPTAAAAAVRKPSPVERRKSTGNLTPQEIEVLKKSSVVNGKVFMPWLEVSSSVEGDSIKAYVANC